MHTSLGEAALTFLRAKVTTVLRPGLDPFGFDRCEVAGIVVNLVPVTKLTTQTTHPTSSRHRVLFEERTASTGDEATRDLLVAMTGLRHTPSVPHEVSHQTVYSTNTVILRSAGVDADDRLMSM